MRPLMRADTPLGVRLVLAGVAAAGADSVAFMLIMRAHPLRVWTVLATYLLVCAGYLALGSVGTARRPRLPLEVTIAIGMLPAACLLAAMPFPPQSAMVGSEVTLAMVLILSGLVVTRPGERARVGRWLRVALAVVGALMMVSVLSLIVTRVVPAAGRFPLFFLELISGASLVGAWHGRSRRPIRAEPSPHAVV